MCKRILSVLVVLFMVSGCSYFSWMNPWSKSESQKESELLGVNPYLWQATITKLGFMPMLTVDSKGGVVVTDWSTMDKVSNEYFKVTVHILSKELRADALEVVVFERTWADGKWENVEPDPRLAFEIEKSILTEARKLFRRDLAAR